MPRGVAVLAALVLVASCSSPATAHRGGPAGGRPVLGAFGQGVFIAGVSSDPWAAVGWTGGEDGKGQPATACFLSPSGAGPWRECRLTPIDTDGPHTRLLSVARVGTTLIAGGVAVGAVHGNPRPYLWSGPLGGPLQELNLPRELFGGERIISFQGLTSGPLGAVAVGTWDGVTNQSVAQVWLTTNGSDWRRLDGVSALTASPQEVVAGQAAAAGPSRVVVVGTIIDLNRLGDGSDGAVWWSDDGTSWSRADVTGAAMGGPGDQSLTVAGAVAGTSGFLAGGTDGAGSAAVWSSADGRTWRRAAPLPFGRGTGATITSVASTSSAGTSGGGTSSAGTSGHGTSGGSGSVPAGGGGGGGGLQEWASGVVAGSPRLWRSIDGRSWTREELDGIDAQVTGPAQAVLLAAGQGNLLVVVRGTRGSSAALLAAG